QVRRGLAWLVEHQLPGGGGGEGEVSLPMGWNAGSDTPNVADTCIAALALIRSGSTPREGPYRRPITLGVGYVCTQVEQSDPESLAVTSLHGTRDQMKLGANIDTYLASVLLAEVRGRMPNAASEEIVDRALDKVIAKIERHPRQGDPLAGLAGATMLDLSGGGGPSGLDLGLSEGLAWAPILGQAMCGRGLNRARQAGARVSDTALARAEDAARQAHQDLGRLMSGIVPPSYMGSRRSTATGLARRRDAQASTRSREPDDTPSTYAESSLAKA